MSGAPPMKFHSLAGRLAALCLLALAPRAHGLVITQTSVQTVSFFAESPNATAGTTLVFDQFNPALGALGRVTIEQSIALTVRAFVSNTYPQTIGAESHGYFSAGMHLQNPGGIFLIGLAVVGNNMYPGSPYSGPTGLVAPGQTIQLVAHAAWTFSQTFWGAADVAPFAGAGLLGFIEGVGIRSQADGAISGNVTLTTTLTYATVPDGGGGAALFAAGLALCAIAHRVHRRRRVRSLPAL